MHEISSLPIIFKHCFEKFLRTLQGCYSCFLYKRSGAGEAVDRKEGQAFNGFLPSNYVTQTPSSHRECFRETVDADYKISPFRIGQDACEFPFVHVVVIHFI